MTVQFRSSEWNTFQDATTSLRPKYLESWFFKRNHPKMAQHFRLVNYYFIYPDHSKTFGGWTYFDSFLILNIISSPNAMVPKDLNIHSLMMFDDHDHFWCQRRSTNTERSLRPWKDFNSHSAPNLSMQCWKGRKLRSLGRSPKTPWRGMGSSTVHGGGLWL